MPAQIPTQHEAILIDCCRRVGRQDYRVDGKLHQEAHFLHLITQALEAGASAALKLPDERDLFDLLVVGRTTATAVSNACLRALIRHGYPILDPGKLIRLHPTRLEGVVEEIVAMEQEGHVFQSPSGGNFVHALCETSASAMGPLILPRSNFQKACIANMARHLVAMDRNGKTPLQVLWEQHPHDHDLWFASQFMVNTGAPLDQRDKQGGCVADVMVHMVDCGRTPLPGVYAHLPGLGEQMLHTLAQARAVVLAGTTPESCERPRARL